MKLQSTKFIGHRIELIGKHPHAGQIGTYVRDEEGYPIVNIPGIGDVRVVKSKHWKLA